MASILIVEDEAPMRDVLRRIAEGAGHRVVTAEDAHAAMDALFAAPIDVVLTDVHMTGANGLWLADQIREQFPGSAIVLVTADDTIPHAESLRRGIIGYVLKPFRARQVLDAIEEGARWAADARDLQA